MIPGTWEPHRRTGAVEAMAASTPAIPARRRATDPGPPPAPRGLPTAVKVSIFAATLLAAGWLVMTVF